MMATKLRERHTIRASEVGPFPRDVACGDRVTLSDGSVWRVVHFTRGGPVVLTITLERIA